MDQPDLLPQIQAIRNKRARLVALHLWEHGSITTQEIEALYGYKHPPRAVRDLRELGFAVETFRVQNETGKSIAAYRFADSTKSPIRPSGRRQFGKRFKKTLLRHHDSRCNLCKKPFELEHIQIDHRIPYEIEQDTANSELDLNAFMPLCASCNRTKSWSCQQCTNWQTLHNPILCMTCYWAHPESYEHMALQPIRRLELVWSNDQITIYDQLKAIALAKNQPLTELLYIILKDWLRQYPSK